MKSNVNTLLDDPLYKSILVELDKNIKYGPPKVTDLAETVQHLSIKDSFAKLDYIPYYAHILYLEEEEYERVATALEYTFNAELFAQVIANRKVCILCCVILQTLCIYLYPSYYLILFKGYE